MVLVYGFDFWHFLVYDFDMILIWFFYGLFYENERFFFGFLWFLKILKLQISI